MDQFFFWVDPPFTSSVRPQRKVRPSEVSPNKAANLGLVKPPALVKPGLDWKPSAAFL